MPKNNEAIRLAECSDWRRLQRLLETAPESAREVDEFGMLPLHWACTESHVPLWLLAELLAAFPDAAMFKNVAELLPLHISIRARAEAEWLEKLLEGYPNAVHVNTPKGRSVLDLAHQVGLHINGLRVLYPSAGASVGGSAGVSSGTAVGAAAGASTAGSAVFG